MVGRGVLTGSLGAGVERPSNLLSLLVRRVAIFVEVLLENGDVVGSEDEALATRRVDEVAARDVERADEALGRWVTIRHLHSAHCCSCNGKTEMKRKKHASHHVPRYNVIFKYM